MDPVQVRTYRDATAEAAAQQFQADAAEAARNGYFPTSQVWEGSSLTVTYQRREVPAATSPEPRSAPSSPSVSIPAVAILIGGILVAVGSLLPWVRVGIVTASGMEGDGILTMVLGVGLILIGISGVLDAARASSLSLGAGIASVLALALAALHIIDIAGQTGLQRQVGEGLYAIAVGGVVALAGAIRGRGSSVSSRGQMPDVLDDIRALPQVFRKPLVWLPFGLLALTFILSVALINGAFDELEGPVKDGISLYISLTLHPTSLFIFFIGGFLAPRGSYIVGGLLGVLSALVYIAVVSLATDMARESAESLMSSTGGEVPEVATDLIFTTLVMGIILGVLVGGFAGWLSARVREWRGRMRAVQP